MWYAVDVENLEVLHECNTKREAVFLYSYKASSSKLSKGIYIVVQEGKNTSNETYIVSCLRNLYSYLGEEG